VVIRGCFSPFENIGFMGLKNCPWELTSDEENHFKTGMDMSPYPAFVV